MKLLPLLLTGAKQGEHRAIRWSPSTGLKVNVVGSLGPIRLADLSHRCHLQVEQGANEAKPLCQALAYVQTPKNIHHELTAHPHLHIDGRGVSTMSWKESILGAFDVFGPASLAMVSMSEAIIQPVPPDLVYIPMLLNDIGNVNVVLWLWFVVTVSSVLGSFIGYLIGQRWGRSLIGKFGSTSHVEKIEALTQRYGTMGIFIAAFSPIPYKVFGWLAGMGSMEKRPFIAAGLIGRGLRFGLEAVLIGVYGNQAYDALMWFLDNEIFLAVLLVGAAGAVLAAWNWWNGLEIEAKQSN